MYTRGYSSYIEINDMERLRLYIWATSTYMCQPDQVLKKDSSKVSRITGF